MIEQPPNALVAALMAIAMLLVFAVPRAVAHEEGVLTVAGPTATQGSTLPVTGTDFSAGAHYRLVLRGALREYELLQVQADSAGAFRVALQIPATVAEGAYRLVAVASDGDSAAAVDLVIEAARAPVRQANPPDTAAGGAAHPASPVVSPTASSEELPIERHWTGFEWFIIGTIFGGALVGGVSLIRRPRSEVS